MLKATQRAPGVKPGRYDKRATYTRLSEQRCCEFGILERTRRIILECDRIRWNTQADELRLDRNSIPLPTHKNTRRVMPVEECRPSFCPRFGQPSHDYDRVGGVWFIRRCYEIKTPKIITKNQTKRTTE